MKRYTLISFDMFQTLVDLDTQKDDVMKSLLSGSYTKERGDLLWEDANRYVYSYFHRMSDGEREFSPVLDIFERCYAELFPKYGIAMDPLEGAYVLARAHGKARFYPGTEAAYAGIKAKYMTCLISDTDAIMVAGLLDAFSFDRVYTSEAYKAYKFDAALTLFKSAIADFGIRPSEMLHVGDGYNDIAGAKAIGADAAWFNPGGKAWKRDVLPDYVIRDLSELPL